MKCLLSNLNTIKNKIYLYVDTINEPIKFTISNLKGDTSNYFLMSLLKSLIDVIIPFVNIYYLKKIVEIFVSNGNIESAFDLAIILVIIYTLLSLTSRLLEWFISAKIGKVLDTIFEQNANKYMHMNYINLDDKDLLDKSRNLRVTESIVIKTITSVNNIISSSIGIIISSIVITILNPVILIFMICISFIIYFEHKKMLFKMKKIDESIIPLTRFSEYIRNVTLDNEKGKEIRVFNIQNFLLDKIKCTNENSYKYKKIKFQTVKKFKRISENASSIQLGILYIFMVVKYASHRVSISDFTMYIGLATTLSLNIHKILSSIAILSLQNRYLENYKEFHSLSEKKVDKIFHDKNKKNNAIEFKNVYFKYPCSRKYTLKNISFKINVNQKVSLVGANGSGKSTIVKLICGLYLPNKGDIFINGINIKEIEQENLSKILSTVFQDYKLFGYSVRDNLDPYSIHSDNDIIKALNISDASGIIKKMDNGLESFLYSGYGFNGYELSGGEEQKLAISRAFLRNSPIMIFDEPTTALDPIVESKIFNDFYLLSENKTTLFISHRLSSVKKSDFILYLENGSIMECGNHKSLMRDGGNYSKMYKTQADYYD